MSREYFKAFHSYLKSIEPLNDAERGRLFTAMLEYSITGEAPRLSGNERFIFPTMQANLDREMESYRSTVERNQENGKNGGRPAKPKKPSGFSRNPKNPSGFSKSQDKDKEEEEEKDKDKDKDKEDKGLMPGAQEPSGPPAAQLPLNTGEFYPVFQQDVEHWAQLYPAVDVLQELRKMQGWLEANPSRRKTRQGVKRFVAQWLAKEQDRGRPRGASPPEPTAKSYDLNEVAPLFTFDIPEGL